MKKYTREILWGLFALYCVFLLWILFFSRETDRSVSVIEYMMEYSNLIPFKTTVKYIKYVFRRRDMESFLLALYNIGGNLILFLPMGFFLPSLFEKMHTFSRVIRNILCMIVAAELMQAFWRLGIPDIDDVIFNFIGACAGYGINKRMSEYISLVP